ncbi:MAG: extracellular solute-binding protein [Anaerovoracaceae bacterium]|jgi:ABC-type Fe3+ transport system substrate-binding protein
MSKKLRNTLKKAVCVVAALSLVVCGMTACGSSGDSSSSSSSDKVVIYTNADDEALDVIKKTLDDNGYSGKYTVNTFGTTELGGKLLAEGQNIEADLIQMSSFYVDSAQEKNNMFEKLDVSKTPLKSYEDYYRPTLANQGAIFYNTEEVKKNNLDVPKSLKDLTKDEYKGMISVPDISGSSTAWLMIQALISSYGEDGTKTILKKIYKNAGDNLESSGSGPIKKVLAGEAAVGFGLRHQAVMDKENGEPIDYVDPTEGDFTLTEGVAVVKHKNVDKDKEKLAQEMANCIIEKGRSGLMKYYPIALYKGEKTKSKFAAKNTKEFKEPLTAELLQKHTKLSESCK